MASLVNTPAAAGTSSSIQTQPTRLSCQNDAKNQNPASGTFSIDLGECHRKSVQALIEARVAQRCAKKDSDSSSLFTRATLLFSTTGKSASIGDIVDRRSSLITLRRTGFTPEDFIQSGPDMTFKRLLNAYNLTDLVKFGFTLDHFCQLGFDTDDLRNFSADHYRVLGLTAPIILKRVPLTGEDLVQFGLEPHFLRELRFTFSHFVNDLSMTADQLSQLMSERDLKMYFSPSQSELNAIKSASTPVAARDRSRFLQTSASTNNLKF